MPSRTTLRRLGLAGLAATCLIAVSTAPNCIGLLPSAAPVPELAAPAADAPVIAERRLVDPILGEAAEPLDAQRVLFLPLANRTGRCLHPTYLRAFDQTLALHAAAFLGRSVVPPDQTELLAQEIAASPKPTAGSTATEATGEAIDRERLTAVARRAGAAVVVWGELDARPGVHLNAIPVTELSSAAEWDGVDAALAGDFDRALYEGPSQLLRAMVSAGRVPPPEAALAQATAPASGAPERIDSEPTWSELWSGDPRLIVRAVERYSIRAFDTPADASAWVGLALGRRVWAESSGPDWTDAVLADGPSAPRQIAAAFSDLPGEAAEFFAALDQETPAGARAWPLLEHPGCRHAALRVGSWLSGSPVAKSSSQHSSGKPSDAGPLPPWLELLHQIHGRTGSQHLEELLALPASELRKRLDATPALARALADAAASHNQWQLEYGLRAYAAAVAAPAALEWIRTRCLEMRDARPNCLAAIRESLAHYLASVPADANELSDPIRWEELQLEFRRRLLDSSDLPLGFDPGRNGPPERDGLFWASLALASEMLELSNHFLEILDAEAMQSRAAHRHATASSRSLLRGVIEEVLRAAALPAVIGGVHRAQRDEAKPYLAALRPYRAYFRQVGVAFALVDAESDAHTGAYNLFGRIATADPYDELAADRMRFYVAWGEAESRPGFSLEKEIERLRCAAPRTPGLARKLAAALATAQHHEAAREVLAAAIETYRSSALVTAYLDQLYRLERPVDERLRFLESLPESQRDQPALLEARAFLLLDAGWEDAARSSFEALSDPAADPERAASACRALAQVSMLRRDWRAAAAQLVTCAERSPDRWAKANDLVRAGRVLRDFDEPERALELHRAAKKSIGGASWILTELGADLELLGRLEEARAVYEQQLEQYPASDPAYLNLAYLHLRAGRPEDAKRVLAPMTRHDNDYLIYDALRSAQRATSELDAFEAEIRKRRGYGRLIALARSRLEDRLDAPGAIEALQPVVKRMPKHSEPMAVLGQALLAAGDAAGARARFEGALAIDSNHWPSRLGLVQSLLALGAVEEAEAHARRAELAFPTGMGGSELWHLVHAAAGRWEAALEAAERARGRYPMGALNYPSREYWYWQQRLLQSELSLLREHPEHELAEVVLRDARRTLQRLPHAAELHASLAGLLAVMGRSDEARTSLAAAARANPLRYAAAVAAESISSPAAVAAP